MAEIVNKSVEKFSKDTLAEIVREINGESRYIHPVRVATISEIRKSDDYEKTKLRLFVLKYKDGVVFMNEANAPEWVQKEKKAANLVDKAVPFMPVELDEKDRICVSYPEIFKYYEDLKERHVTFKVEITGASIDKDGDPSKDELIGMCNGQPYAIRRPDIKVRYSSKENIGRLVGTSMIVCVKEVTPEKIYCYGDISGVKRRDEAIKKLQNGESLIAKIVAFNGGGAIVTIDGVTAVLKNRNFSEDWIKISDVKKVGDSILVKLNSISKNNHIHVEPVEKYAEPKGLDLTTVKPGDILKARVTNITMFAVFVNIAHGVDALCSVPDYIREPIVGDVVRIKLTQVDSEANKVRAKIVGYVYDDESHEESKGDASKDAKETK